MESSQPSPTLTHVERHRRTKFTGAPEMVTLVNSIVSRTR
jgi:hypothetical protein